MWSKTRKTVILGRSRDHFLAVFGLLRVVALMNRPQIIFALVPSDICKSIIKILGYIENKNSSKWRKMKNVGKNHFFQKFDYVKKYYFFPL